MDFSEDPVIEAVRDTVRRVYEVEIAPKIAAYEASGDFPYEIIQAMGDAGLFGAAFPEEMGGTALGFAAVGTIAEEISRLSPGFGYAMNMQAMTCPFTILNSLSSRRRRPGSLPGRLKCGRSPIACAPVRFFWKISGCPQRTCLARREKA